jgi:thiol-disulfide isomerase/thioredoxin
MQFWTHAVNTRKRIYVAMIAALLCGSHPLVSGDNRAQDFVVYSIEGKRTIFFEHLASLPDNGLLLVNFTSIHCKPCRKEIPELVRITGEAVDRARLICIYSESGNPVREMAAELNILDKAYVDPLGNIQKQYDVKKIPVTYIVRKDGVILGRYDGYTEDNVRRIREVVMMQ